MLSFKRQGQKWYAETSEGELAFGDYGGLYQWHMGKRIDYSGADRQCSSDGSMWQLGSAADAVPTVLGYTYAMSNARKN